MANGLDIQSGKITIYDSINGALLTKTRILEYNSVQKVITVDASSFDWKVHKRLHLLIIQSTNIITFEGTVRKSVSSSALEIALYNAQSKSDRKAPRYDLSSKESIKFQIIDGEKVALVPPLLVTVGNISSTGLLLMAEHDLLFEGMVLLVPLSKDGFTVAAECSVVRIKSTPDDLCEYGCKFLKINRI